MDKPKILGVITARGGSKGIPGKNIKMLGDKPLIAYTIEAARKSNLITHLIVSTDDEAIARTAKEYGAEVPFMRPKELAQDITPHLPVMRQAIEFMEKKLDLLFDYVVIFQPTSPFRTVDDIDGTIQKLIDTGADSAVSVCEVDSSAHPMKIKKLEGDRVRPYCLEEPEGARRQDLPVAYKRSSAVYAMKRDLIMKANRLYGEFIVGHIVPTDRSIDIDTPFDWLKAEYMLEDFRKKAMGFNLEDRHIVLSYHYIRPQERGIYPCSPEEFERQIKFISKHYRFAAVGEVFAAARDNSREKLCAVTLDDGTKDHYQNARPILLAYKAIATFFPIAGVFDGLLPFVHRVHVLLANFKIVDLIDRFNTLVEESFSELAASLIIPKERRRPESTRNDYGGDFKVDNFKETMALATDEIRERFMDQCFAELKLSLEDLRKRLFMTEDELRDLHHHGFLIGNHTYNHVAVDQLSANEFQRELEQAHARLQEILGEQLSVFSYPWGRSSPVATVVLKRAGFTQAVTIERRGVASDDDPLLIPRYDTNDLRDFLR